MVIKMYFKKMCFGANSLAFTRQLCVAKVNHPRNPSALPVRKHCKCSSGTLAHSY